MLADNFPKQKFEPSIRLLSKRCLESTNLVCLLAPPQVSLLFIGLPAYLSLCSCWRMTSHLMAVVEDWIELQRKVASRKFAA